MKTKTQKDLLTNKNRLLTWLKIFRTDGRVTNMNEQPKQTIDEEYMKNKKVDGPTLQIRTMSDGAGRMHQGYGKVTINRDYGLRPSTNATRRRDVPCGSQAQFQSFATDSVANTT